jgi:carbon starvation protein
LFILTTIDAGTRVGRYLLQDALGHVWKPLRQTGHFGANLLASGGMVLGWGFFLIMGVRDPDGGVKALWPIFGISNQMLAGIALCLATTVILKMGLQGTRDTIAGRAEATLAVPRPPGQAGATPVRRAAAPALITFIPLVWLLAVTMTAGAQKLFDAKPNVGFLAANRVLSGQTPKLEAALAGAEAGGDRAAIAKAGKSLRLNRVKRFNNSVDALATGFFMLLVGTIVALSVREWMLLLARKKLAELHETAPVWLPGYAVPETRRMQAAGLLALGFALARELSGEAQLERAREQQAAGETCSHWRNGAHAASSDAQLYVEVTEQRYRGVRRCC